MPVSKRVPKTSTDSATMRPYWTSECGRAVVYVGDCREVMVQMEPEQFHAVVTDPPYGLEFMGKEWDAPWKHTQAARRRADELNDPVKGMYLRHNVEYVRDPHLYQEWFQQRAEAMLRVVKPGAHLLSFGGTRMYHRMACAIEDAGFEIRDTLAWVYGTGFPKGLDVSKAIDKLLGADRKIIGPGTTPLSQGQFNSRQAGNGGYGYGADYNVTAPASDEAQRWNGWNTVLKPAYEPIVLARKSLVGSVAKNILEHGCGGLNVDACRIGTTGTTVQKVVETQTSAGSGIYGFNSGAAGETTMNGGFIKSQSDGRYPANLLHDGSDEVAQAFPEQSASRLFYTAKANDDDRPHGKDATTHPTVKPLDLMQYLARLVCPLGGTVLDPFMGSGSTGCAAIMEGMRFVGIEQSQEYADIAVGRLKLALEGRKPEDTPDAPTPPKRRTDSAPPSAKRLRGV